MTDETHNPSAAKLKARARSATGKVSSETPGERKKGKRAPKDPIFKDIISLYFTGQAMSDFSINPGLQVGQTQLEIDVAVRATENLTQTEIYQRLKDTPFYFFAYLNLLEFKSVNDKLDLPDFYRTAARALLAAAGYYEKWDKAEGKNKKPGRRAKKYPHPPRVVSCLVCATYPQNVQDQLQIPFQPLEGQPKGFYFRPHASELFLPGYLIVCSELPIEEKYYPLLVFAAGNKLEEFIEVIVDRELEFYVKYATKLHSEQVYEALNKRKRGTEMTKGQEGLVKLAMEIFGEEELAKMYGEKRLVEMLRSLKPSITVEELKKLLDEIENSPTETEPKQAQEEALPGSASGL